MALNYLMIDKDIGIQKADKGNTVVLTNKNIYLQRINDIIGDETKFKKLCINTNDSKQCLKYILDSEKRVRKVLFKYSVTNNKCVVRLEFFQRKSMTRLLPLVLGLVLCMVFLKYINHWLMGIPNSVRYYLL